MFSFKFRPINRRGREPGTHGIGGSMDPRADRGALGIQKRLIVFPRIELLKYVLFKICILCLGSYTRIDR